MRTIKVIFGFRRKKGNNFGIFGWKITGEKKNGKYGNL